MRIRLRFRHPGFHLSSLLVANIPPCGYGFMRLSAQFIKVLFATPLLQINFQFSRLVLFRGLATNQKAGGSNPSGRAIFLTFFSQLPRRFFTPFYLKG